jgi:hypothetical protein
MLRSRFFPFTEPKKTHKDLLGSVEKQGGYAQPLRLEVIRVRGGVDPGWKK